MRTERDISFPKHQHLSKSASFWKSPHAPLIDIVVIVDAYQPDKFPFFLNKVKAAAEGYPDCIIYVVDNQDSITLKLACHGRNVRYIRTKRTGIQHFDIIQEVLMKSRGTHALIIQPHHSVDFSILRFCASEIGECPYLTFSSGASAKEMLPIFVDKKAFLSLDYRTFATLKKTSKLLRYFPRHIQSNLVRDESVETVQSMFFKTYQHGVESFSLLRSFYNKTFAFRETLPHMALALNAIAIDWGVICLLLAWGKNGNIPAAVLLCGTLPITALREVKFFASLFAVSDILKKDGRPKLTYTDFKLLFVNLTVLFASLYGIGLVKSFEYTAAYFAVAILAGARFYAKCKGLREMVSGAHPSQSLCKL